MDVATELHHRVDALRHRFGVEAPEQVGTHVRHVIDPGNERVPAVSGDHDVARRIEDRDAIGGCVGLDIPAMRLRLEPRAQLVEIVDEAIEPGPGLHHDARKVAIRPQQRGDDCLHPCRAALGRRRDKDVSGSVVVGGPPGAVGNGCSIDSLLRPHLHPSPGPSSPNRSSRPFCRLITPAP